MRVRFLATVSGDRDPQLRPCARQGASVDSELLQRPRSRAFNHNVDAFQQLRKSAVVVRVGEVECDEFAPLVQVVEERRPGARTIGALGAFDRDYARAAAR